MKKTTKYEQKNPLVGVRFSPAAYKELKRQAKDRRWSMANLVAWCVEEQLGLKQSDIDRR